MRGWRGIVWLALAAMLACSGGSGEPGSIPAHCVDATRTIDGAVTITGDDDGSALGDVEAITGDLVIDGSSVATLSLDCIETIGGKLDVNQSSTVELSLASLRAIGDRFRPAYSDSLTAVSMPSLQTIGGSLDLHVCAALTELELPALTEVGGDVTVLSMTALRELSLPALDTIRFENVTSMPTGQGVSLGSNPVLGELSLPALTTMGGGTIFISGNDSLARFAAPALRECEQNITFLDSPALVSIELPQLVSARALSVVQAGGLRSLSLPLLRSLAFLSISQQPVLESIALPAFTEFVGESFLIRDNPALPQCLVDAVVDQLRDNGYTGPAASQGNRTDCTCNRVGDDWQATCP